MVGDYISRVAALTVLDWDCASQDALNAIKAIPAADVVEVDNVNYAVYEALRTLDALNGSGRLDYGDYCELHDAISAILQDGKYGGQDDV